MLIMVLVSVEVLMFMGILSVVELSVHVMMVMITAAAAVVMNMLAFINNGVFITKAG